MDALSGYEGREQARVKHEVLETYLTKLFMIVGQHKAVMNYIDCFAGPWQEESNDLKNTSIGISIGLMKKLLPDIRKHNPKFRFRAFYIEKDKSAFTKLKNFIDQHNSESIELKAMSGDYTTLIPEILKWCNVARGSFSFFFVDPKEWKGLIEAETMKPLLQLPNSEFVINFMYDFINRAATQENQKHNMGKMLGEAPNLTGQSPESREFIILSTYKKTLNNFYNGRYAHVRVNRPGTKKLLYLLVYLTRHPKGIIEFKIIAENIEVIKKHIDIRVKFNKQLASSGGKDLFMEQGVDFVNTESTGYVSSNAIEFLKQKLEMGSITIDQALWSKWLEESDFLYLNCKKA